MTDTISSTTPSTTKEGTKPKHLKELVFEICENLYSKSEKITRAKVKEGTKRGSDRDLSTYIKDWKLSKGLVQESADNNGVPDETAQSAEDAQALVQEESADDSGVPDETAQGTEDTQALVHNPDGSDAITNTEATRVHPESISNGSTGSDAFIENMARRGAELATAMMIGEKSVAAYLLNNPDKLPEDLKEKIAAADSAISHSYQKSYDPNELARQAIQQFG